MPKHTRRNFIRIGATTALLGAATLSSASAEQVTDHSWTEAESPTSKKLNDGTNTAQGPFICGAEGNVLARHENGWELVVEYGPQARSRSLTGIDSTDDGKAVWFVGESGVIGEYRVETQTLTNYSAPNGKTSTWEDCAVQGNAGENERLYFVNGSGELLVGVRQDSGAVQYKEVIKPGGGSTIPQVDFYNRKSGHVCSTSQFVGESVDGGESWEQIGIDFSGTAFYDLASRNGMDVNVAAGSGIIYRYDGFRWTPHVVDDGRRAIRAVDRDGEAGLAAGDGGTIYERQSAGQWRQFVTDIDTALDGAVWGDTYDVVVGNGGTILEREVASNTGDSLGAAEQPTDDGDGSSIAQVGTAMVTSALPTEPLSVKTYVDGTWEGDETFS